jgi:hypothetical protein
MGPVFGTAEFLKVGIASIALPHDRSISSENDERTLFKLVSIKAISVFRDGGGGRYNGPRLH